MAGDAGGHPVLDYFNCLGPDRPVNIEAEVA
jgi:hypothetical protein